MCLIVIDGWGISDASKGVFRLCTMLGDLVLGHLCVFGITVICMAMSTATILLTLADIFKQVNSVSVPCDDFLTMIGLHTRQCNQECRHPGNGWAGEGPLPHPGCQWAGCGYPRWTHGDPGNSEVGQFTTGTGRVVYQVI